MKFLTAIPVYNEERHLEKVLAEVRRYSPHILVVNDGSTDGTADLLSRQADLTVLTHPRNRGYGAAIQTGFAHGGGDLLGFLDADGTCDPRHFAPMCRAISEGADVVLGSRMGEGSEMPLVRALGNTLFAWMLGILSRRRVRDTASGMRVLGAGLGAPDTAAGRPALHPAMSAHPDGRLRLVELRSHADGSAARSSVLRDGLRFLACIVQAATTYRPRALCCWPRDRHSRRSRSRSGGALLCGARAARVDDLPAAAGLAGRQHGGLRRRHGGGGGADSGARAARAARRRSRGLAARVLRRRHGW
jgi:hypothetical protein